MPISNPRLIEVKVKKSIAVCVCVCVRVRVRAVRDGDPLRSFALWW
jgi:hypothetical protein